MSNPSSSPVTKPRHLDPDHLCNGCGAVFGDITAWCDHVDNDRCPNPPVKPLDEWQLRAAIRYAASVLGRPFP